VFPDQVVPIDLPGGGGRRNERASRGSDTPAFRGAERQRGVKGLMCGSKPAQHQPDDPVTRLGIAACPCHRSNRTQDTPELQDSRGGSALVSSSHRPSGIGLHQLLAIREWTALAFRVRADPEAIGRQLASACCRASRLALCPTDDLDRRGEARIWYPREDVRPPERCPWQSQVRRAASGLMACSQRRCVSAIGS